MPVIQLRDQPHQLKQGQTRLGSGPDADVRVSDDPSLGVQALLDVGAGDQVVIRRARADSVVKVNGVALGAEPTPLIHGDKVEIGGAEFLFSDDKKGGATQYVSGAEVAAMAAKRTGPARATTGTGGRLVSLVDGKEYTIADAGLSIGREAGNDVVVAQGEVSRKHASIAPGNSGYVLTDHSANGVFVNGERVEGTRLLARADVIRVGGEEFRFYADVAPSPSSAVARPAPPPPQPPPPPPPPAVQPAPITQEPLGADLSAAPVEDTRPVLATLDFEVGAEQGRSENIRGPLTNIGRGSHNDVVIADRSVSDSHAKLLRRDDGWYLADAGSTNGTFVGSSRITSERRLDGSPDIKFGTVIVRFRPAAGAGEPVHGTRPIAAVPRPPAPSAPPAAAARPAPRSATPPVSRPATPPRAAKRGVPAWVWILVVLAVAAGVAYFLKG
ncbi:MAG TPA: FHA domain-containing protein [Gemmatimonadaceae bacterium]|nr:FHA domain-containing protein [Gemmatimonadaceae bacterium]